MRSKKTKMNRNKKNIRQIGGTNLLEFNSNDSEIFDKIYLLNNYAKKTEIISDEAANTPKLLLGYNYFLQQKSEEEYIELTLTYPPEDYQTYVGRREEAEEKFIDINKYYNKSLNEIETSNKNFKDFMIFLNDIDYILYKNENEELNESEILIKIKELFLNRCVKLKNIKEYFKKYILILFSILAYNKEILRLLLKKLLQDTIIKIGFCDENIFAIKSDITGQITSFFEKGTGQIEESRAIKARKISKAVYQNLLNLDNIYNSGYVSSFEYAKLIQKTKNDPNWTRIINAGKITGLTLATSGIINTFVDEQLTEQIKSPVAFISNTFHTTISTANILASLGIPIFSSFVAFTVMAVISSKTYKELEDNFNTNLKMRQLINKYLYTFDRASNNFILKPYYLSSQFKDDRACSYNTKTIDYLKRFDDSKNSIMNYTAYCNQYFDIYLKKVFLSFKIYFALFEKTDIDCSINKHLDILIEQIPSDPLPSVVKDLSGQQEELPSSSSDLLGTQASIPIPGLIPNQKEGIITENQISLQPKQNSEPFTPPLSSQNMTHVKTKEMILNEIKELAQKLFDIVNNVPNFNKTPSNTIMDLYLKIIQIIKDNNEILGFSCFVSITSKQNNRENLKNFSQAIINENFVELKNFCKIRNSYRFPPKGGRKTKHLRRKKTQKRRKHTHKRR
jgi:hypothetical protein